jgi:hypothetical protein
MIPRIVKMLGVNTPANVPSVPLVSEVPDLLFGIEAAVSIINPGHNFGFAGGLP